MSDRQHRGASFMDTGLTTIPEAAIEKHRATAQSFITRIVVLEDPSRESGTALAGTNRRFVSTVSVGSVRRTREVELAKTVAAVHPDDQLLTIPQHTLLFRARRGTGHRAGHIGRLRRRLRPRKPAGKERPRAAGRRRRRHLQEAAVGLGLHFRLQPRLISVPADRQRRRGAQRHHPNRTSFSTRRRMR